MSIVFNERAEAEKIISTLDLGKQPYSSLSLVSRYFASNGMSESQIRQEVESILIKAMPSASVVSWSDYLDRTSRYAKKHPITSVEAIYITDAEMNTIRSIDSIRVQRLAFTLLCLAKYKYSVSPANDYWVSYPDGEIRKMANITVASKGQCAMFKQLRDMGLIKYSKHVDNLSVQVMFHAEGDIVMTINDLRNLGYQYMMFCGPGYIKCSCCGITVKGNTPQKKSGRKQMYCRECAAMILMKQKVDFVMRQRSSAV